MGYPIDEKLVIAIASSALFDLTDCDRVFQEQELDAYRAFQRAHENVVLPKGVAFPLIQRILALNDPVGGQHLVEVVLLSRNDPDTGLRVFKSIEHYQLDISRAVFVNGGDPFRYLGAFNTCLFLSANPADVSSALERNVAAGTVLPTQFLDDNADDELRIAFDFDGVLADDSAETVCHQHQLPGFFKYERENARIPLPVGPLHRFCTEIAKVQKLGRGADLQSRSTPARIRTAIVTARNAPAHERVVTSLRNWGIEVDEVFFLGGIDKTRVLQIFRPHIFFDDLFLNVEGAASTVPCAHVPFGITNQSRIQAEAALTITKKPLAQVRLDADRDESISA